MTVLPGGVRCRVQLSGEQTSSRPCWWRLQGHSLLAGRVSLSAGVVDAACCLPVYSTDMQRKPCAVCVRVVVMCRKGGTPVVFLCVLSSLGIVHFISCACMVCNTGQGCLSPAAWH